MSLGLVGWLSFRNGQKSATLLANELSQKVAQQIEDRVLMFASTHHLFLHINAAAIQTQTLPVTNIERLEQYFWQQLQATDDVSALYFADPEGRFVLVKVDETPQVYIRDETTAPLRHIYNLDATGQRGERVDQYAYDPRERPWYLAAEATQDATWSEIYTFAARPVLGITPVVPLYEEDGSLQGVLAADITLRQLSGFLQGLNIGDTGEAFIMERTGHLVASSSPENTQISEDPSQRQLATQSHNPKIRQAAAFLQAQFGQFTSVQSPRPFMADFNGAMHFVQLVPLQDGRGLDWLMVVIIPVNDFMDVANANARTALSLGMVAIIVAIGSIVWITYWITKPVLIVSKAAQAIAAGQLDQNVSIECVAETNQLIHAFNDMASQLKRSFERLADANRNLESQVEQRTAQLEALAITDALTQVLNRRGFDLFLQDAWIQQIPTRQPLSLIFCDVDYFKAYNDTYGHIAGDDCLKVIATLLDQQIKPIAHKLSHALPANMLVARYGGEEFIVVLPETSLKTASVIAEEMRNQILQAAIPHRQSSVGYVTASFGVATQIPTIAESPMTLLRQADDALYTAKCQGRNQIVLASSSLSAW